jgi:nitrate/TMAO reductase-like tetraheme cytochrome c subunit
MMKRIAITLMLLLMAAGPVCVAGTQANGTPEAKWQKECSACHVAYPPRFLTAPDWKKLMTSLDRHFGDNASVDAATEKDITGYLERHAGTGSRHSAKTLRISDTPWFDRAHRELPRGAWTNPAVKSASNCTACHVDAARGDWSEHGVLLPPGIGMKDEDDED